MYATQSDFAAHDNGLRLPAAAAADLEFLMAQWQTDDVQVICRALEEAAHRERTLDERAERAIQEAAVALWPLRVALCDGSETTTK